jgi:kynurenine formamidase
MDEWRMTTPTEVAIAEAASRVRNWNRWGPDDEIGTLNYVTPEKTLAATQLVRRGQIFSLSIPYDLFGPQNSAAPAGGHRMNPLLMVAQYGPFTPEEDGPGPHASAWADDMATLHLQSATHLDALGHQFDRGRMWNGYTIADGGTRGFKRNAIQHWRDKLITRGVLLDIARFKGVDYLENGYAITEADLLGCIASQGSTSTVGTGDIVLLRTGQLGFCKAAGWGTYSGGDSPGLSFYTADWLYRTEIAGVASDTWGVEVRPNEFPDSDQPLHQVVIPNTGLLLGENFDLDDFAADCAADHLYECLFIAAPIQFTGSVSGVVNPQAVK